MSKWRDNINQALDAFITVSELAGDPITFADLQVEYLDAPHKPPTKLPHGKMAIYGFCLDGEWLKIGKAGPNTNARYTSQHYNPNSSRSNLAKSLIKDKKMQDIPEFAPDHAGEWIKTSTCRVNILLSSSHRDELLSLLEAFLHVRLHPRYEGLN